MITAISNSNGCNSKVNSANYNSSNETRKANNSSRVIDSFANSKQVSFKGNLAKAGEGLFDNAGSKIGSKFRRLGEEASEAIGSTFSKLVGKNELPAAEKPKIAPYDSVDLSKLKKSAKLLENPNVPESQKRQIEDAIKFAEQHKNPDGSYSHNCDQMIDRANTNAQNNISDSTTSFGAGGGEYDGGDLECGSVDIDFTSLMSLLGS